MKVAIAEILFEEQKTSKSGKQYTVTTFKDGLGVVYKDVYGKFTAGQDIDGEWKDGQYGRKFEVTRENRAGGFGGRPADNPETRNSIERQSALKASVEAVCDYYDIIPDPELTLESYITKVVNVTNVFAKAIAGTATPSAPAAVPTPAQETTPDPEPGDQINLDDIPF